MRVGFGGLARALAAHTTTVWAVARARWAEEEAQMVAAGLGMAGSAPAAGVYWLGAAAGGVGRERVATEVREDLQRAAVEGQRTAVFCDPYC